MCMRACVYSVLLCVGLGMTGSVRESVRLQSHSLQGLLCSLSGAKEVWNQGAKTVANSWQICAYLKTGKQ